MDETPPASTDEANPHETSLDEVWQGKTTIAPDVLLTIARLSALGVAGVAGTSSVAGGVNRLFQRGLDDGVRIEVKDQAVSVDLYLMLEHDHNVRQVGRAIQAEVTRAIQEMTGMDVVAVNVYVEDIAYPEQAGP
jgi:uncharacterized alkaline shock family protein YloU